MGRPVQGSFDFEASSRRRSNILVYLSTLDLKSFRRNEAVVRVVTSLLTSAFLRFEGFSLFDQMLQVEIYQGYFLKFLSFIKVAVDIEPFRMGLLM